MLRQGVGFTFREKMSGGFSLAVTDPAAGADAGNRADTLLTMHCVVTIPDLDAFFADSEHPGTLTGEIDFAPLGSKLASTSGLFNLFSPTDLPDSKYMVYELGIDVGGHAYYFAGHKDVKRAPVTQVFKATTTLYARLHDGPDKTGPVIGAGILTLGVGDLLALIPTMHATNAGSVEKAVEATAKFGEFFVGELWNTYVDGGAAKK